MGKTTTPIIKSKELSINPFKKTIVSIKDEIEGILRTEPIAVPYGTSFAEAKNTLIQKVEVSLNDNTKIILPIFWSKKDNNPFNEIKAGTFEVIGEFINIPETIAPTDKYIIGYVHISPQVPSEDTNSIDYTWLTMITGKNKVYYVDRDGKLQGLITNYYPNSNQVYSQCSVIDGLVNGLCKCYYENGHLKMLKTYKMNVLHGLFKIWHQDGFFLIIGQYKDGKRIGTWTTWWNNERLQSTGSYINGQEDGKWIYYYENGNKKAEGSYKNGIKVGEWIYYKPTGKESRIEIYP